MGSRYLLTGVQLELIILNTQTEEEVNLIRQENYVGDSHHPIEEDVNTIKYLFD